MPFFNLITEIASLSSECSSFSSCVSNFRSHFLSLTCRLLRTLYNGKLYHSLSTQSPVHWLATRESSLSSLPKSTDLPRPYTNHFLHYSTEIQRYLIDSEDPRNHHEDEELRPTLRGVGFDFSGLTSMKCSKPNFQDLRNNNEDEEPRPSLRSVDFNFDLDFPEPTLLELRKNKLTASTFGAAVGMWAGRRAQLWLEKLGFIEPFSGNSATQWKNLKSEFALNQYLHITGHGIKFLDFKVYRGGEDWLSASPYGVIVDKSSASEGVLEIKCPFFQGNVMGSSPWVQVPVFYMPQVQGLMEILDIEWLDLFCWTPNGSSLIRVPRDREYWCLMKTALVDFWWKHVIPAREILSVDLTEDSVKELKMLRPRPRHELFNSIACASRHLSRRCALIRLQMNQMPRSNWRF